MLAEAVSTDVFLGGRLRLRQPVDGHRAGTDAILLAAAAPAKISGLALDLGAGVGAAGLALAELRPQITLGLIENDPVTAGLARDNLNLNGFADRGRVFDADVLDAASLRAAGLVPGSARLVLTNPPFFDPARTRPAAHPGKSSARAMPRSGPGPLADWIAAAMALLEDAGLFLLIHRPQSLSEILAAMAGRAGAVTLLPVLPHAQEPAGRILLRAKKASRAPLILMPPLILHDAQGFLPRIDKIHRGEALIDW